MSARPTAGGPVLVTGASGFVGSHLVRALAAGGRPVLASDLAPALPASVLTGLAAVTAVEYRRADLTSPGVPEELLTAAAGLADGPCDVVHLAALTRFHGEVSPTPHEAMEAMAVNAEATWRLCRAFHERSLGRLVVVSTRSVFGRRPASASPIGEDEPYAPAGFYGSSKAAGEVGALAFAAEYGLDLAVVRITGAYGPWQTHRTPVTTMVDDVLAGRPHRRPQTADQEFEFTYVKDIAAGMLALLGSPALPHPLYHLGSGRMDSLAAVAEAVRAAVPGAEIDLGAGTPAGFWPRSPLAVSRMEQDVGFVTRWSLAAGLADHVSAVTSGAYGVEVAASPVPR